MYSITAYIETVACAGTAEHMSYVPNCPRQGAARLESAAICGLEYWQDIYVIIEALPCSSYNAWCGFYELIVCGRQCEGGGQNIARGFPYVQGVSLQDVHLVVAVTGV